MSKKEKQNQDSFADILGSVVEDIVDIDWDAEENVIDVGKPDKEEKEKEISEEKEEKTEEKQEKDEDKKEEPEGEEKDLWEEKEESDEEDDGSISDVIGFTVERLEKEGFFEHYEIEDPGELTPEEFIKIVQAEAIEKAKDNVMNFMSNLSDDLKRAIQWEISGNKFEDFVSRYKDIVEGPSFDVDTKSGQEEFLKWYLVNRQDFDTDDAEKFVKSLAEDEKKLEKYAKSKYDKFKKQIEDKKKSIEEEARKRQEEAQKALHEKMEVMKEIIVNINDIDGIPIHEKEKPKILKSMFEMDQEVDGEKVTLFQKKLAEILNDKRKTILLAKLVINDLDMKTIIAESEKKLIRRMSGEESGRKKYTPTKKSKRTYEGRSLADQLADMFG